MLTLSKGAVRTVAIANVLIAIIGLALSLTVTTAFLASEDQSSRRPFEKPVFLAMTAFNVLLSLALLSSGVIAWRVPSALRLCKWVYILDVSYLGLLSILGAEFADAKSITLSNIGETIGAIFGLGNVGITAQLTFGLPCLGLLIVGLVLLGKGKKSSETSPVTR